MAERAEYIISLKDAFSGALNRAQVGVNNFEKSLNRSQHSAESLGSTLGKAFLLIGGAALGKDIVDTTAQIETLNNVINYTAVDAQDAAKNHAFLNEIITRMKLPLIETTEGFSQFSASLIGSKLQGQGARDIFEGVANAVTALHLPADKANAVFYAMNNMMSAGKVMAQDLKLQMGNALPGAFSLAARSMHLSTAELSKMMERGELVSEDFLPKFAAELKRVYSGAVPNATKSLQANLTEMSNEWIMLKRDIGEVAAPALLRIMRIIKDDVIPAVRTLGHFIKEHSTFFKIFGGALLGAFAAFKTLNLGITLVTGSMSLLNAVMAMNPIGLLIVAAAGLGVAFYEAYENIKPFKTFVDDLWISIKVLIQGLWDLLTFDWKHLISDMQFQAEGKLGSSGGGGGSWDDGQNWDGKRQKDTLGTAAGDKGGSKGGGGIAPKSDITKVEGQRPQNFYLNIQNLIKDGVNISSTTIKEGTAQMKDEVLKALLAAMNDVAIVARNS